MASSVNAASALLGSTATNTNTSTSSSAASAPTQTLGQDAFLKLLMAQLQNQDPLQPSDPTTFVTQLSQFSMVEQSVQQSTTLGNISSQLQSLTGSQATALVGKSVTAQNTGLQWNGTFAATGSVTLGGAAQSVSVQVQDSNGNTVRTMTLGPQPAGVLPITWDGHNDAGTAVAAGSYSMNVTATGANSQSVAVSQSVSGTVTQVSPNGGSPTLTLDNGTVVSLSQLVSVSAAASSTSK